MLEWRTCWAFQYWYWNDSTIDGTISFRKFLIRKRMTSTEEIPARLLRQHIEIWPVKCCEPTEDWNSTFSHRPSRTSKENKRIKSVLHFGLMIPYFSFCARRLNDYLDLLYNPINSYLSFNIFPNPLRALFARCYCKHIAFGIFVLIFFLSSYFTVEVTEVVTKTVYRMSTTISISEL